MEEVGKVIEREWVKERRADFPILDQRLFGNPLVYLDNAATTQLPRCVTESIVHHYENNNANVHRGIHSLSVQSTKALERARKITQKYIEADSEREIVFTSGTTASINMLALMWETQLHSGDSIVVSSLEHHSNFVPWQQLCKRTGADFKVVGLTESGDIDLTQLEEILKSGKVSLVSIAHVSNVLGMVSPIAEICNLCHSYGAVVSIDAAQSARHETINVKELGCDFLSFSGHKILAPTGIGVLYGKIGLLESLSPVLFGGEMVNTVRFEATSFEGAPIRFEPGTPNYVGAIALGRALEYLEQIGRDSISTYEGELVARIESRLNDVDKVHILGSPKKRAGCVSFYVDGIHPFDLAEFMDKKGIAIRSGNQCAQPLLNQEYEVGSICRISPAFYNTCEEIDQCIERLKEVIAFLSRFAAR